MNIDEIAEQAINQAKRSQHPSYKHGCVIFSKKGVVISKGYNNRKIVPMLRTFGYRNIHHHAESHALMNADPDYLVGASLLVVRGTRHPLKSSKPCAHCMGLLREAGIRKVYYSVKGGEFETIRV